MLLSSKGMVAETESYLWVLSSSHTTCLRARYLWVLSSSHITCMLLTGAELFQSDSRGRSCTPSKALHVLSAVALQISKRPI